MKNNIFIVILLSIMILSCKKEEKMKCTFKEIKENWQFRQVGKDNWLPATVPGCVQTDLLENKLIPDPFNRTNEKDLQWIDKEDWEYSTILNLDTNTFNKKKIELIFKGLDCFADIYLNDTLILRSDNMFREYIVDSKKYMREGENKIRILFHSPTKIGLEKYDKQGYVIPLTDNDQSEIGGIGKKQISPYIRKAGYHFGWDWGPRFETIGIWRPIYLKAWNDAIISDINIRQQEIHAKKAKLTASLEINSAKDEDVTLNLILDDQKISSELIDLKTGMNIISKVFIISKPKLWWPNGMGKQYLYKIKAELVKKNKLLDTAFVRIGLRTIEVVQDPDSAGRTFYFKVNGKPVFVKGADYIPQDNFINRVTPEKYDFILQSAVDANMNMLRVWGGGIYQQDVFYNLCDEKGILIWHDFMFACSMYPGDSLFLDNIKHEAIDNIKRLRNHPCIALWCGNNENLSGWAQWHWNTSVEKESSKKAEDELWKAYENMYYDILPGVVKKYDSGRFYWSSSPSAYNNQPQDWKSGDVHYWGVWHGKEPFSAYQKNVGRFMSEYGFQSFPEFKTVKQYTIESDWDIFSEVMKSHQRSRIGNEAIEYYMLQSYNKPKDFQSFLYLSQIVQADGVKLAMEAHRRKKPYCMGTMFWQIDDCWPVASWSSIDYYGRWKALHYYAKKAYNDLLISPVIEDEKVKVYVVSDQYQKNSGKIELQLMDFKGVIKWSKTYKISIEPDSSQCFVEIPVNEILQSNPPGSILLYASLVVSKTIVSDNILHFAAIKELKLEKPVISEKITRKNNKYLIRLKSDKLAKYLYLSLDQTDGVFSDNYFDLLPGIEKEIVFKSDKKIKNFNKQLKIMNLMDAY